jgi:ubiquinone/menaquinone biosynthesis C-methylase UbiE
MTPVSRSEEAKVAVRQYFDREVDDYLDAYTNDRPEDVRRFVFVERRDIVLEMTPARPGRVLDIGAGPGVFTRQLLDRGASCWVVDLSSQMVATARRQFAGKPGAMFIVGDIDRLPFADGSFDVALCVGVLQYLPSIDVALRELARVVTPGGKIIVTFPNEASPLNRLHQGAVHVARRLGPFLKRNGAAAEDPSRLTFRADIPNRWLSAGEVEGAAAGVGLTIDALVYHVLQFPFSIPGLGFATGFWNRRVRGRLPRGRLASWGREGVVRFTRTS